MWNPLPIFRFHNSQTLFVSIRLSLTNYGLFWLLLSFVVVPTAPKRVHTKMTFFSLSPFSSSPSHNLFPQSRAVYIDSLHASSCLNKNSASNTRRRAQVGYNKYNLKNPVGNTSCKTRNCDLFSTSFLQHNKLKSGQIVVGPSLNYLACTSLSWITISHGSCQSILCVCVFGGERKRLHKLGLGERSLKWVLLSQLILCVADWLLCLFINEPANRELELKEL